MRTDRYFEEITGALIAILRAADGDRIVLEQVLYLAYVCGIAAVEGEAAKDAQAKLFKAIRQDMQAVAWKGLEG